MKQYSEDLRAQAHEFTNKLYVILGLIQLGVDDAIALIQEEATLQTQHSTLFMSQIQDEKVQAILLGKLAKASEKKINFIIDPESTLHFLPKHIGISPLITILGNIIDNAFDAVANKEAATVTLFVTDVGNDIIFEIEDTGKGIEKTIESSIFMKAFSSKGVNRGYGLANVKEEIDALNGWLEYSSEEEKGTTFTIILPKKVPIKKEE
ncbi:sensor histidine kinase [Radiobacillus deserti]|uniref:sensor histidine kinase n=1 Tax=Radiobacillus deserti TaxID=2594883 RepID=UPI001E56C25B|nr:ATP-binding protein [Radiobacillus deserti]